MDRVPPNKKFGYSSNRSWLNGMGWGIAIRLRKLSGSWRKVLSGRLKLGLWKALPKSLSIFFAEFLKFSNIAIDFCFYIILFCIWNCFVKKKNDAECTYIEYLNLIVTLQLKIILDYKYHNIFFQKFFSIFFKKI